MTQIITIANQKGGVGKTATAINLSSALAFQGKKVLVIDSDPQGNLSNCLGLDSTFYTNTLTEALASIIDKTQFDFENLIQKKHFRHATKQDATIHYIPTNPYLSGVELKLAQVTGGETAFRRLLKKLPVSQYNYIIIDTKPSLGKLLISNLLASDCVIIPIDSKQSSLEGYRQIKTVLEDIDDSFSKEIRILGLLQTMVTKTNNAKEISYYLQKLEEPVFNHMISFLNESETAFRQHESVFALKNSKLAKAYMGLANEIIKGE